MHKHSHKYLINDSFLCGSEHTTIMHPTNEKGIIESVNSISRDGPDAPSDIVYYKNVINVKSRYIFKPSRPHHHLLRVIYYQNTYIMKAF